MKIMKMYVSTELAIGNIYCTKLGVQVYNLYVITPLLVLYGENICMTHEGAECIYSAISPDEVLCAKYPKQLRS